MNQAISDSDPLARLQLRLAAQFLLGAESAHGPTHWRRVETIGMKLARETGADEMVVRLFAWFHDSRRENESLDHDHGRRGADLAASLRGKLFELDNKRFETLLFACRLHTGGMSGDATIGTCWDADRLDLYRVGLIPDRKYLNTAAAKTPAMIHWALSIQPRRY
jgi:uncharacterized protein